MSRELISSDCLIFCFLICALCCVLGRCKHSRLGRDISWVVYPTQLCCGEDLVVLGRSTWICAVQWNQRLGRPTRNVTKHAVAGCRMLNPSRKKARGHMFDQLACFLYSCQRGESPFIRFRICRLWIARGHSMNQHCREKVCRRSLLIAFCAAEILSTPDGIQQQDH